MVNSINNPINLLPEKARKLIENLDISEEKIREIRIRVKENIYIITENNETDLEYLADRGTIKEILEQATGHSMYAYEEALRNGYITISGGHRIGIAGQAVVEGGMVKTIKNISSLNIRFANEIKNCGDKVIKYILDERGIKNTLIISPPGFGKTTLLRDILRQVSGIEIEGHKINVSIIDERSEIAAVYKGIPQNDVGSCTDILDGCPKAEGMMMMLRTMAPDVLGIDELGLSDDIKALKYIVNCGCHIMATIHGESLYDVKKRDIVNEIFDRKIFDVYIILGGKGGVVKEMYDKEFNLIREGGYD